MAGAGAVDQAVEALRLAEAAPERAVVLSPEVAARARDAGDWATAAVAERAWGLALRNRGDLDSAVRHLRVAVRLGDRAKSPQLRGEARMTLALALTEGGRPQPALEEIDAALRDLEGLARARALTQRGTILLELGRYPEAMEHYRLALPVLRAADDRLWLHRVMSNRGLAHAYRHELTPAEADLREAERLARQLDLPLVVGFAQANLAFVLAARGDVPAALDYQHRAEQRIRAHGAQAGSLLQDRSELLLSVRLVSQARETAEQAVRELEKEGRKIKLPEVRLVLAQAALLDGDHALALQHARIAVLEFTRLQRPEWAALARLAVLRAQCAEGRRVRVGIKRVQDVIAALEAARWRAAAMEARLLAAKLLLDRGQVGPALNHLGRASRSRRGNAPATLRARAWYAEGLLRGTTGDRRGAASALRAGLRILDRHHAALGATDLRAHVAGHRTDLAEAGLRIALGEGRPRDVFAWAERGRASHLLQPPLRPPDDPVLAECFAELRATVAELHHDPDGSGAAGQARLLQRQAALERQIQHHLWRRRGEPVAEAGPAPVRAVAEVLGGYALLEYVRSDGVLYGLSLVDGRVRLRRLGALTDASDLVDRIPFALRRLNRRELDPPSRAAAVQLLRHTADRLDRLLLRPFPEVGDRPLVIVPTAPLQSLPWSVLPSCTGRPVTVSPSATIWHTASRTAGEPTSRVAVAAGPTLPGARDEARAVADIYGTAALLPPAATVDAVMASLNGAAIAHLATHGRLSTDNPLFSDLLFADGPLLVYDLEGLPRVPHTVVLAACNSARSLVCAGDELLGLSATFLARGASQLVASVIAILDAETAPFMVAFHHRLAAGQPPAVALAASQETMAAETSTMAAAAGFICMGAGFLAPRLTRRLSATMPAPPS
jgi:tetratricopeptide (TPR) repeat protein